MLCSLLSEEAGEPLLATASYTEVWFVLEVNQVFGAEAFAETPLPDAVRAHLSAALKAVPRSRMQLIRVGKERPKQAGYTFYVALGHEIKPLLYKFQLGSYEDLLGIDLVKVAAESDEYAANLSDELLYLICTNGKRDRCCARFGIPIYEAMSKYLAERGLQRTIWTTAHIGGHRFAGTGVFLPAGICYGRMPTNEAAQFVESYREGELLLDYYRGRCAYPEHVQAAEHFIRERTGMTAIAAVRFVVSEATGEKQWRVDFEVNGTPETVHLKAQESDFLTFKNSTDVVGSHVTQFSLVE
jgi:hypothetical protein